MSIHLNSLYGYCYLLFYFLVYSFHLKVCVFTLNSNYLLSSFLYFALFLSVYFFKLIFFLCLLYVYQLFFFFIYIYLYKPVFLFQLIYNFISTFSLPIYIRYITSVFLYDKTFIEYSRIE